MGKSISKPSAESSLERPPKHQQLSRQATLNSEQQQQQANNCTSANQPNGNNVVTTSTSTSPIHTLAYSLNEKELRNWCRGFNKDFPDAQLTHILDNEHLLAPFLTDIFYQEVEVSDCMQTLFRGNCLASKIMSHCFRTFGSKYLKQLLEPHIKSLLLLNNKNNSHNTTTATAQRRNIEIKSDSNEMDIEQETAAFTINKNNNYNNNNSLSSSISSSPIRATSSSLSNNENNNTVDININNHDSLLDSTANIENTAQFNLNNIDNNYSSDSFSYEIDSSKLEAGNGNIGINQRNLLKLTKKILESILASANDFPPQLNSMCICLLQVLCKKYPNSNTNLRAVGTVIFLRFINPAIVSPYEAGIVDTQPPQKIMRGLMLVSKILQNIANNVEFSKEEHMLPFNDFVRAQFEPMRQWVSKISSEQAEK